MSNPAYGCAADAEITPSVLSLPTSPYEKLLVQAFPEELDTEDTDSSGSHSPSVAVLYRHAPGNFLGSIVAFHGGCFVGGDPSYDSDQNVWLASLGYNVIQFRFPTDHMHRFDEWSSSSDVEKFVHNLASMAPVFCLGRSSGGYLAKHFFKKYESTIRKVVYLCPVLRPIMRAVMLPEFAERTAKYFAAGEIKCTHVSYWMSQWDSLADEWQFTKEVLVLAEKDENVPRQLFYDEQLETAVTLQGCETHRSGLAYRGEALANCFV